MNNILQFPRQCATETREPWQCSEPHRTPAARQVAPNSPAPAAAPPLSILGVLAALCADRGISAAQPASPPAPVLPVLESAPRRGPLPPLDRNEAIKRIKKGLESRTGRRWSVTGGSGTSWGWIKIKAMPARCTWGHRLKPGMSDNHPPREAYEPYDTGESGRDMSPDDTAALAAALDVRPDCQGESIAASSDYYWEYVDRAEGRPPRCKGEPYWD